MHVLDITLKCIIVSCFFTRKYNLLYICCLIRQPAQQSAKLFAKLNYDILGSCLDNPIANMTGYKTRDTCHISDKHTDIYTHS